MDRTRRDFFAEVSRGLAATVWQAVEAANDLVQPVGRADDGHQGALPWVRPPGALAEPAFRTTCTKCTACQEACSYQSIRRMGSEWGDQAGTPVIIPAESPCYLCADMPCIAACEPRALLPVLPCHAAMGTAVLQRDACYLAQGQPCDYCVTRCPLTGDAIRFAADKLPVIDEDRCAGCGVCAFLCPPGALKIVPVMPN